jgi:hypothetical protein
MSNAGCDKQLPANKRVTVSEFKNATYVNIREYYKKDNKTLPGKKVRGNSSGKHVYGITN